MKKEIALVFMTLFLFGCTAGIPQEESLPTEVFFCEREDCEQRFAELADSAETINCAFYEIDSDEILSVLNEKGARLVIDDKNDSHQMHNKFCIFDSAVVWTGSLNPRNATKQKANNIVIVHSKFIAQNYEDEFEELQRGIIQGKKVKTPLVLLNGNLIETYFCPEDSCKEHVLDALEKAKSSIYFMTFSFTDDDIGKLLLQKSSSIEVKGLFDKSQNSKWSEYDRLKDFSAKVSSLHHKVFIIDNETVITGSYNPTANGNERNDENLLIIHDKTAAERFVEEFSILSGRAFSESP